MRAFVLYLLWHCPEPSSYHPVGRLVFVPSEGDGLYEFTYLQGAAFCYRKYGFQPIAGGFPGPSERYLSADLFPFFANRVMATSRPDYAAYLERLGLETDPKDSLVVLARGGRKATDGFETFEYPRFDPATGRMIAHFWLRGRRHVEGAEERCLTLHRDQRLYTIGDRTTKDPYAIALHRELGEPRVGYLSNILTREFDNLMNQSGDMPTIYVSHVNPPPAPVQQRVLCRMEAPWPADYVPFTHEAMLPLAKGAWDLKELMDPRSRVILTEHLV